MVSFYFVIIFTLVVFIPSYIQTVLFNFLCYLTENEQKTVKDINVPNQPQRSLCRLHMWQ